MYLLLSSLISFLTIYRLISELFSVPEIFIPMRGPGNSMPEIEMGIHGISIKYFCKNCPINNLIYNDAIIEISKQKNQNEVYRSLFA